MLVINTEKCTGCRTCELACSYHHRRVFSPNISSVHIKRNDREGEVKIIIYEKGEGTHLRCDCPRGKEFCLKYCPVVAQDELKTILNQRNNINIGKWQ